MYIKMPKTAVKELDREVENSDSMNRSDYIRTALRD